MKTLELIPDTTIKKYDFPYHNRYRKSKVYHDNGETFFGTFEFQEIPKSPSDKYYQIKPGEECRWDLISYKHYDGMVDYWWVICAANDIYDPFEIVPAGTIVRIPSLDTLVTLELNDGSS